MSAEASTSNTKLASELKKLQPRAYLEAFVEHGYRPDGRTFEANRSVHINTGSISTADGSALVRLGNTTVVCGIRAEIAEPDLMKPNSGFLIPNIDLPPLCAPDLRPGPPSDDAQALAARLHNVLLASIPLSLADLCIEPRKATWSLFLDVVCINYDGNILDAAVLAASAALKNTTLPAVSWNEDIGEAVQDSDKRLPLQLGAVPLSFSFSGFNGCLFSDPTSFEESLSSASVSVILDETGQLRNVSQTGLGAKSAASSIDTRKCIALARTRCNEIRSLLP